MILGIVAQGAALIFILGMLVTLILSQKKDGAFTADEASKVVIICTFIFMIVSNAYRPQGTDPVFDMGIILLTLGSVLGLAGIDIIKAKQAQNGTRKKDSTNGI